jgi:hypothetical protein
MGHEFLKVNNNEEGKQLIRLLRKNLRNTPKGIRIRGRGPRNGNRHDTPHKFAKLFAIYTYTKPTIKSVRVVDLSIPQGYRFVTQPTKYHPKFKELMVKA